MSRVGNALPGPCEGRRLPSRPLTARRAEQLPAVNERDVRASPGTADEGIQQHEALEPSSSYRGDVAETSPPSGSPSCAMRKAWPGSNRNTRPGSKPDSAGRHRLDSVESAVGGAVAPLEAGAAGGGPSAPSGDAVTAAAAPQEECLAPLSRQSCQGGKLRPNGVSALGEEARCCRASSTDQEKETVEEDLPEGTLIGTEMLPQIGAAGVLVLPIRRSPSPCRSERGLNCSDVLLEELTGWERGDASELQPSRLFDESRRSAVLREYVDVLAGEDACVRVVQVPMESTQPPLPAHGPNLRELWLDPKRREDCPICAETWIKFTEALGQGVPVPTAAVAAAPAPVRRRGSGAPARGKMHSVRCTWSWFQQNLCSQLRALRFDVVKGQARSSPPSPSSVLPPPISEVVQYWRQQKVKADREVRITAEKRVA